MALMLVRVARGVGDCTASNNADTNSAKECKYLSPCTKADVPAAPSGYTMECETMPCSEGQDIMFDKIEGTDLGELLPSSCDNTVEACRTACEATVGCCGFNFVFNPGQYSSQNMGRCVAKACDGRIGTSRYGMVFYLRDGGAATATPTSSPTTLPTASPTTASPTTSAPTFLSVTTASPTTGAPSSLSGVASSSAVRVFQQAAALIVGAACVLHLHF